MIMSPCLTYALLHTLRQTIRNYIQQCTYVLLQNNSFEYFDTYSLVLVWYLLSCGAQRQLHV